MKAQRVFRRLTPFCPFLLACALLARAQPAPRQPGRAMPDARVPSREQVSRAIALSGDYLIRACGPDGRFVYQIDTATGRESPDYNIVRHVGVMYALGMLRRLQPDPRVDDALVRAATFLRENYINAGGQVGILVVREHPKPQGSEADLGGTGMGLVALAAVNEARPNSMPLDQLQALGRFALSIQKTDGSFRPNPANGTPVRVYDLYYPGETALGFISLYEADHSPEWLIAAAKALSYLAGKNAGLDTVPADPWILIATAKLLPYCDSGPCSAFREELLRASVQMCASFLKEQINRPGGDALNGAFDEFGSTTATAARMEGLLAALEFLPDSNGKLRAEIEAAVQRGVAFLLKAQIQSGPYQGGMPGAYSKAVPEASRIQMDYVSHALCAWIRYQRHFR